MEILNEFALTLQEKHSPISRESARRQISPGTNNGVVLYVILKGQYTPNKHESPFPTPSPPTKKGATGTTLYGKTFCKSRSLRSNGESAIREIPLGEFTYLPITQWVLTLHASLWGQNFPNPKGGAILFNTVTMSTCFTQPRASGSYSDQTLTYSSRWWGPRIDQSRVR